MRDDKVAEEVAVYQGFYMYILMIVEIVLHPVYL